MANRNIVRIAIPFHRQDTNYTCGPAALQMLIHHFNGVYPSERTLARRMHTKNSVKGESTKHAGLIRALRGAGLYVYVDNNASLKTVEALLTIELPVLVHYLEPEAALGHYAIIVGASKERIYLNDPWYGSGFSLLREEFLSRWRGELNTSLRWLLVASPEPIFSGAHYAPKELKL